MRTDAVSLSQSWAATGRSTSMSATKVSSKSEYCAGLVCVHANVTGV